MTSWLRSFQNDERGSATVESLFWVPIFVYLLVLITDVSFVFYGKAQALRIIQDGNRALSVRYLESTDAAEEYILGRLTSYSDKTEVETAIDDGVITTIASLPARDLMAVGSIPGFNDTSVSISAQHFLEQ